MNCAIVSLSIDDGHPLDMRMADLLRRHRLRATFYVPVRNCEGPPVLSGVALRELSGDFEIGSHTLEHRYLSRLDNHQALEQITAGKQALQALLGKPVHGFCYPGGRYRDVHCRMVQSAGFLYARTTQNLRLDAGRHRMALPTTLQFYPHSRSVLMRNFISQGAWRDRRSALSVVLQEDHWLDRLRRLFAWVVRRGGIFHLWCHSLDIDRLALWPALDRFLAELSDWIPAERRLDNLQLAMRYVDAVPDVPLPAPDLRIIRK